MRKTNTGSPMTSMPQTPPRAPRPWAAARKVPCWKQLTAGGLMKKLSTPAPTRFQKPVAVRNQKAVR